MISIRQDEQVLNLITPWDVENLSKLDNFTMKTWIEDNTLKVKSFVHHERLVNLLQSFVPLTAKASFEDFTLTIPFIPGDHPTIPDTAPLADFISPSVRQEQFKEGLGKVMARSIGKKSALNVQGVFMGGWGQCLIELQEAFWKFHNKKKFIEGLKPEDLAAMPYEKQMDAVMLFVHELNEEEAANHVAQFVAVSILAKKKKIEEGRNKEQAQEVESAQVEDEEEESQDDNEEDLSGWELVEKGDSQVFLNMWMPLHLEGIKVLATPLLNASLNEKALKIFVSHQVPKTLRSLVMKFWAMDDEGVTIEKDKEENMTILVPQFPLSQLPFKFTKPSEALDFGFVGGHRDALLAAMQIQQVIIQNEIPEENQEELAKGLYDQFTTDAQHLAMNDVLAGVKQMESLSNLGEQLKGLHSHFKK